MMTRAAVDAARAALEDRYRRRPAHFTDTILGLSMLATLGVTDLPDPRDVILFVAESADEADEWIRLTLAADGPLRVLGPVNVDGQCLYGYDMRPQLAELAAREEAGPDAERR